MVLSNGDLREESPLIVFPTDNELTDGLALGSDGNIYVALPKMNCISIVTPIGKELRRIPVPGEHVSSVCFGGTNLEDLFITTMHETVQHHDGGVYRMKAPVAGLPVPIARVRIPGH